MWSGTAQDEGEGLPGQLLELHPVTAEGLAAKAAAICAMGKIARYTVEC